MYCRPWLRSLWGTLGFSLLMTMLLISRPIARAEEPVPSKPVILLTGFEPFGAERPANPSWEGIRDFHETDWEEYRVLAIEMPVVWGEPLRRLEAAIKQHNPVAIFSFGQGLPGAFALESRASNTRGPIPDNGGQLPSVPRITEDGPESFESGFPLKKMAEQLRKKGHPVRVSRNAGQYLCEETLYSLEYLRQKHDKLTVSFCHVPPLNSRLVNTQLGKRTVDRELIRAFVHDYLEAWKEVSGIPVAGGVNTDRVPGVMENSGRQSLVLQTPSSVASPLLAASPRMFNPTMFNPTMFDSTMFDSTMFDSTMLNSTMVVAHQKENPELEPVRKLIHHYFKTWSEQRMKDYADCFAEGSVVQEISRSGEIFTQEKAPFVAGQAAYHKSAVHKAVEVPVTIDITFEADMARAVVYWKLTAGPRLQYGYDHFTLLKQKGEWKIVNLVFYGVPTKDK